MWVFQQYIISTVIILAVQSICLIIISKMQPLEN